MPTQDHNAQLLATLDRIAHALELLIGMYANVHDLNPDDLEMMRLDANEIATDPARR